MDFQKEREAFENHLKKMGKTDNETFSKNEDDSYQMDIIHFGWKIWQAAKDESHKQAALYQSEINHLAQANQQWREKAAKAQAVPEWISVKDNLPPENILVLGMSQTRSNIFNVYNVMALDEFEEAEVTHWMPLSDAPQEPDND